MSATETTTLYEELDTWARSRGSSADQVLQAAVADFHERVLNDTRLASLFVGANHDALNSQQLAIIQKLLSGDEAGGYTEEELHKTHEDLVRNRGLRPIHLDSFMENVLACLREEELPPDLVAKVQAALKQFRKRFEQATTR